MTTLYLAWQDADSRRWFPVGRLDADENAEPPAYGFSYVGGAREAGKAANFFCGSGIP